ETGLSSHRSSPSLRKELVRCGALEIPWPQHAAQGLRSCDEATPEKREAAPRPDYSHDAARRSDDDAAEGALDEGASTDSTVRRCVRPSRAVQSIDCPAARPISAAPIGVRIDTLPSAMSASPGNTRVTRRSSPRSLVKRRVE